MKRADAIWNKGTDLIDDDGEVRELTDADFRQMKPFSSLPPDLQRSLLEINRGSVTSQPGEEQVKVKVSRSVVDRFRAEGGDEGRPGASRVAGRPSGELSYTL